MEHPQLVDYIKSQVSRGFKRDDITKTLLETGWNKEQIDTAFNSLISIETTSSIPATEKKPFGFFSKKMIVIFAIVIFGVLAFGGGTYAYFNYFQNPEKIFNKMLLKTEVVKTWEYSGKLSVEGTFEDKDYALSSDFGGVYDMTDVENPKISGSVDLKLDMPLMDGLEAGLDIKSLNKNYYFNVTKTPEIPFVDLSDFENQWVKLDLGSLQEQLGIDEKEITSKLDKSKLTKEQIDQIRKAVIKSQIIEVTEKLKSEKLNDVNTYHYKFVINKDGLKEFLLALQDIVPDESSLNRSIEDFDETFKDFPEHEGEIWIGKKDSLLYKVTFSAKVQEEGVDATIALSYEFKNYNKPVLIEEPEESKSLIEMMSALFAQFAPMLMSGEQDERVGLMSGSQMGTTTEQLDSDGDGIYDSFELQLGTDPMNPDTDGDGIPDNEDFNMPTNF
ncbi:MAG: hypothetical protein COX80_00375 [Candidatus Magasanikbacteria bacterium CG_4_10_14_0_2_um_filter_33_14]|uniref:Uncharacterized protein n=1 Tax=Candidatus Magasanikbacteria bacterium CG_4_10_14_0_2_um_filter_33_14 TaxID=1974636 RepID=A0A2M7VBZ6_9BACT|nr:MAG: hypothetical protein COX80_00375 [Candidatus Magasanikbacteria bacterium CG_4_10_14_0_2_um_filter_33_14]